MISGIGFFKLHRCLFNKPIWLKSTPEQKVVLITLLSMANFKPKEWEWKNEKFKVEKGQFITSLNSIVENCGKGITIQNVRSALKRFEKLQFLTNESTKEGRLITIANWELYQSEIETQQSNQQRGNKEVTKDQQRGNKELTPREESNKDKERKERKESKNINDKKPLVEFVPKFNKDSIQMRLVDYLCRYMLNNNPNAKIPTTPKQIETWCDYIDKIIRIDNYTPEQIKTVIKWCQTDEFWKSNILSAKKLRVKMPELILKAKEKRWFNKNHENVKEYFENRKDIINSFIEEVDGES